MTDNFVPAVTELRARVILYIDGTVHLCLDDYRTFHCSAVGLMAFISNPVDFLSSEIQEYESSNELNPDNTPLMKLPGVTLASFNTNGVLAVHFPELLQAVFSEAANSSRSKRLNLAVHLEKEPNSYNNKSYLLKYFLDFRKHIGAERLLKQKVNMNEEAFFSIMREIFNSYLSFEQPKSSKKSLESELNDASHRSAFDDALADSMVSITQYANHYKLPRDKVWRLVTQKKFKNIEVRGRNYYLDINEKPPLTPKKKQGKSLKIINSDLFPEFDEKDWPKERVRNYIIDNKIYSSVVAELIYSRQELELYQNICGMREVNWGGQRFLIMPFDFEFRDSNGVSNLERMRGGHPPLIKDTDNPDAPPMEARVHHIGQQKIVYASINPFIHSKYHGVLHPFKPKEDLHDSIFDKIKHDFWEMYAKQLDRYGSFEKIPYTFPKQQKR